MISLKVNFDEEVRALLILCSLPKRWNGLVMIVSNFVSSSNTLKFDDVVGVILSEKIHRKTLGGPTLGSVLNAKSRGKSKEKGKGFGGHGNS